MGLSPVGAGEPGWVPEPCMQGVVTGLALGLLVTGRLFVGEHRGLGAGVSKVRSLKMDRKVWTESLIEVRVPPHPHSAFAAASPSAQVSPSRHLQHLGMLLGGDPHFCVVGGVLAKLGHWPGGCVCS